MTINVTIISKNDDLWGILSQHSVLENVTFSSDSAGDFVIVDDEDVAGQFDDNRTIYLSPSAGKYRLSKPFAVADLFTLLAKIMAEAVHSEQIPVGEYKFNYAKKILFSDNEQINLTEKEAEIIQLLLAARPEAVEKKQLLENVWGYDDSIDTHTLETHMYRLRKKIGDDNFIVTDKYGYKIT